MAGRGTRRRLFHGPQGLGPAGGGHGELWAGDGNVEVGGTPFNQKSSVNFK